MDDTEQNDTKVTGAPVMDVQPPSSSQPNNNPAVITPSADDMPSLTDESAPEPAPKPEAVAPVTEPAPALAPTPNGERPNLSMPEIPAHAKKKPPVLAIVLLIIIALGLAGGAVYLYMKTEDSAKNTQDTSTNVQTQPEAEITPEEIDATIKEVDETVNGLNDAEDLNANDLSDSTLGL